MTDKTSHQDSKLGRDLDYPQTYDAGLLDPIPRRLARDALWGDEVPEFKGFDLWTAFELSWLNSNGVPQVAIAEFSFPAHSANIIESKSFKYYLNSFNQMTYATRNIVAEVLKKDLSVCVQDSVDVRIYGVEDFPQVAAISGYCVDQLDVAVDCYEPNPDLLECSSKHVERKQLYSHLLKSNCPVTGQPDWATVWIEYSGKEILPESFLRYVVSYRGHQDFHESCVEAFFKDIMLKCQPSFLSVFARYTRRGGLDINPYRSSAEVGLPFGRLPRQ
ncbi:NADPH-dependent 7-cyano-7-deazaguanine reductase QueF [Agarilytica rhodophyticola]|uniref:NADPH-dependent 7-cyano-7-deazaguanine reductase QueF n=1 Tax=Agarilytica rhodophyticola TaxID=1737490 RepID=UPI000B347227|nr:NADPH-dependent 7-cyano-7-deazaguanine reductase QueF [Agarilytica rhodophyticola]